MCLLAMAMTSRFASTSSRHIDSLNRASLQAQQLSGNNDCETSLLNLNSGVMEAKLLLNEKVRKSAIVQVAPVLMILPTGEQTATALAPLKSDQYSFQRLAANLVPDPGEQRPIESKATFLCNEPNSGDGKRRAATIASVGILGLWQAHKLFSGSGDSGDEPEAGELRPPENIPGILKHLPGVGDAIGKLDDLKDKLGGFNPQALPGKLNGQGLPGISDLPSEATGAFSGTGPGDRP
jgi:hypothetical protein